MAVLRRVMLAAGLTGIIVPCVAATELDVVQARQKFDLTSLSVHLGDTVHFLNHDDVNHNIMTVDSDLEATDHGLQKPGETLNVTFDQAGTFQVRCSIHPTMKMTITVR